MEPTIRYATWLPGEGIYAIGFSTAGKPSREAVKAQLGIVDAEEIFIYPLRDETLVSVLWPKFGEVETNMWPGILRALDKVFPPLEDKPA